MLIHYRWTLVIWIEQQIVRDGGLNQRPEIQSRNSTNTDAFPDPCTRICRHTLSTHPCTRKPTEIHTSLPSSKNKFTPNDSCWRQQPRGLPVNYVPATLKLPRGASPPLSATLLMHDPIGPLLDPQPVPDSLSASLAAATPNLYLSGSLQQSHVSKAQNGAERDGPLGGKAAKKVVHSARKIRQCSEGYCGC